MENHMNTDKIAERVSERLLGCSLTYNDDQAMTTDERFYFTPSDEPVMTMASLGRIPRPTGKYKIALEYAKLVPGGHWEPDDVDIVEHGRYDSMTQAVVAAFLLEKEWQARDAVQCAMEATMPAEEWA